MSRTGCCDRKSRRYGTNYDAYATDSNVTLHTGSSNARGNYRTISRCANVNLLAWRFEHQTNSFADLLDMRTYPVNLVAIRPVEMVKLFVEAKTGEIRFHPA